MFRLLLILVLTANISLLYSQSNWLIKQSPTTKWLYKCSFPDSLSGWASGDSGVIVHTSDAGETWSLQSTGVNSFIYDIYFINERLGWGISNSYLFNASLILTTTNGGVNWNNFFFPDTTIIINTVYFLDSLNGFMGGFGGVIVRTTDGGTTWNRMNVVTSQCSGYAVRRFNFYSRYYAAAVGGIIDLAGVVWRTTDAGLNWHARCVGPEPVYGVFFKDSLRIIGTGGDLEYGASVISSTNGGLDWNYQLLELFGTATALTFRTPSEAWAPLSYSLKWAVTTDSGNSWFEVGTTGNSSIYDAVFTDPFHGYAVGEQGRILKYNRNAIGISSGNLSSPLSFKLYQNFPNPFNAVTSIQIQVSSSHEARVEVFDSRGSVAAVLLNEKLSPGMYKVKFDGSNYSSGVYFYRLELRSNGKVHYLSKKMVLLK